MNQQPGALAVDLHHTASGVTVSVSGDLDLATAQVLVDRAQPIFAGEAGELTMDVGQVQFCDSAGISALVRLRQQCEEHGWLLRMVNAQPAVRRMLVDFTGLGEYLNVV